MQTTSLFQFNIPSPPPKTTILHRKTTSSRRLSPIFAVALTTAPPSRHQTFVNAFDGVRDETASNPCPWAIWTRAWSAEENRHGDLLQTYLYLSGRVDMLMVEKTLQYSIGAGIVSVALSIFIKMTYKMK
ncbi:hypothetical protein R3W88_016707 [Solanum pinnatisectum]|uniref:Uncharacterized protein n=1 Tax=Solanum pinnatisectum TaxID=50273 RepID=A0AAV9L0L8_9SOLN|nr:hypothetical protein R3W88_016707 [Solanum pinnatisectum]